MQTFILEEKNFEEAQQAYSLFPNAEKHFQSRLNEYQTKINNIKEQDIASIQPDLVNSIDEIANDVELSMNRYNELKDIITNKFDQLVLDCNTMNGNLVCHERRFNNKEESEYPRNLLNDAIVLKNENQIIDALDKIYAAKESFSSVLSNIMKKWITDHQKNLEKFTSNYQIFKGEKNESQMPVS